MSNAFSTSVYALPCESEHPVGVAPHVPYCSNTIIVSPVVVFAANFADWLGALPTTYALVLEL